MPGKDVARAEAPPRWARVAIWVSGALALGTVTACATDATTATTTTVAEFEAITIADATELVTAPAGLTDEEIRQLLDTTCDGDADQLAEELVGLGVDQNELQPLLEGLGEAAQTYCPTAVEQAPGLLNDANAAAISLLVAATSTTTTTAPATTTTAPPTTLPPTTTAPPPPPPPTTIAPAAGVYYDNCSAARAAGAAPLHRGDPGYRSGLDRDSDGVACE